MMISPEELKVVRDTPSLREEYRELRREAWGYSVTPREFNQLVRAELRIQDLPARPQNFLTCAEMVLGNLALEERESQEREALEKEWEFNGYNY